MLALDTGHSPKPCTASSGEVHTLGTAHNQPRGRLSLWPSPRKNDASLDCHHVKFPPLIAMSRSTVTATLAVRVDKPVAGAPNA